MNRNTETLLNESDISRAEEFKRFRELALEPYSTRMDREDSLVPEILEGLRQERFLCPNAPREYGGRGLGHVSLGLLLFELGRASTGVAALVTVQSMVMRSLLRWGTEMQRSGFAPDLALGTSPSAFALTEPSAGSQASAIKTQYVRRGTGFQISGKKKWITAGQIAEWMLVFAAGEAGHTAFMVHNTDPGVSIRPIHGMLGQRGSMLAEITLQDCEVPHDRVLGKEGAGIRYVAAHALELGRYGVAFMSVGLAQACLDASRTYARERSQFDRKIGEHQLIQRKIADMATNLTAAKLMCLHVGRLLDAQDPRSAAEAAMAKYFASRAASRAASEAVQIHGAVGCSEESNVERFYRDSKILEIIEGTSEVHQILLSKHTSSIPF